MDMSVTASETSQILHFHVSCRNGRWIDNIRGGDFDLVAIGVGGEHSDSDS